VQPDLNTDPENAKRQIEMCLYGWFAAFGFGFFVGLIVCIIAFAYAAQGRRTEVGNDTRHRYRELSPIEKDYMAWFKDYGQDFIDKCRELQKLKPEAARELSLAIVHAEDAVMRAVRGVTQ